MPQGQVTYATPPRVQRSVTMPIPGLPHGTQVASGPYQNHAPRAPIMSHSQSDSGVLGTTQIPTDRQTYRACVPYSLILTSLARGGVNGVEDDSDYEEDRDDSATDCGGTLPKGPLAKDRPLAGMQNTQKHGEPLCPIGDHIHALIHFSQGTAENSLRTEHIHWQIQAFPPPR
jgi:hypothetical protein